MTQAQAKQKLIAWAQAQVGVREGGGNWNQYAENEDLAKLYGWKPQNQPWCDTFVDTGFIECFGLDAASRMTYQPIGAGSALCKQSAQYYRAEGAFVKRPEPGDQIFFFVNGDINHTGIVTRVYGGTVVTVEGNSSDMVAERTYSVNDGKIAGYGRPKWSVVSDEPETPTTEHPPVGTQETENASRGYALRFPYLRRGDTGAAVIAVQFQLAAQGYDIGPDGADGDFGRRTEAAVGEFQGNVGITPDGVVGPETGARLFGGEKINLSEIPTGPEAATATQTEKPVQEPNRTQDAGSFWNALITKIKG